MAIEIILDARNWNKPLDMAGSVAATWNRMARHFENQPAIPGQPMKAQGNDGSLCAWVVTAPPAAVVEPDTEFVCLDVIRNPKVIYICRDCGKYGPLRCLACADAGAPNRLCSDHAFFIKDRLTAYCAQHLPRCHCSSSCGKPADFQCRRCRKFFGNHNLKAHPHDNEIEYCLRCYRHLFDNCVPCRQRGRHRLGRSKCAFHASNRKTSCGTALCWDCSVQWRVWRPDTRGIALCPAHSSHISCGAATDLLFTLLQATPPLIPVRPGEEKKRRAGLPTLFRLRRMLNYQRVHKLQPADILRALMQIENPVRQSEQNRLPIENPARQSGQNRLVNQFEYMKRTYSDLLSDVARREPELLSRIRAYYVRELGPRWAEQIRNVEIIDQMGRPPRYKIELSVNARNVGPLIGQGGSLIRPLKRDLGIEIEIREAGA